MHAIQSLNYPNHRRLQPLFRVTFIGLPQLLTLLLLAVAFSSPASAQRRDFPATYSVSKVSELEDSVQLTLSLTIHSYQGKDIQNCGIVLMSTDLNPSPIGTFSPVKLLPTYRDITVSHTFTLSKEEYGRWQTGIRPSLVLLLPNGHGGTRYDTVDAHPQSAPVPPTR